MSSTKKALQEIQAKLNEIRKLAASGDVDFTYPVTHQVHVSITIKPSLGQSKNGLVLHSIDLELYTTPFQGVESIFIPVRDGHEIDLRAAFLGTTYQRLPKDLAEALLSQQPAIKRAILDHLVQEHEFTGTIKFV